jgi:hypothetical protein
LIIFSTYYWNHNYHTGDIAEQKGRFLFKVTNSRLDVPSRISCTAVCPTEERFLCGIAVDAGVIFFILI